jgi:DNA-binding NarL/FixJ family response regulator
VIDSYLHRVGAELSPLEQLTPRQREILQLIAEGKNTKQIASTLEVSVKTVEAHRLQLMARLDIHDVPGLVRYAIRNGLVSSEK